MECTELAGCLVIEDGKVLLLYREDENHWEVPGGKVEENESPTEAAIREAKEEVGLEVELEKPFFSGEFQHKDQLFLWHGYIASVEGDPELQEPKFSELKWIDREELRELKLAPNLEMIKPGLMRLLK